MSIHVEHAAEHEHHQSLEEVAEDLRRAVAAARSAHVQLREEERRAWAHYTDELGAVVERMDADLAEQRAALASARAAQRQELREAVAGVAERAQMALGELRVQEALAEMEARDRLGDGWRDVFAAVEAVRGRLRKAVAAIRAGQRPEAGEGAAS